MKKCILFLLLLTSFQFLTAQQYTKNQPFDTTLYSGYYILNGGCTQTIDTNIELDTSLYNYVSGMTFMVIIDSVSFAGPIGLSPVQAGDTFILDSITPAYSMPAISGLEYWFRIKLTGTPSIVNQNYPCKIDVEQCTCFCLEMLIKASSLDTSTCFVSISNNINQHNTSKKVNIYPNPAIKELTIDNGQLNIKNIEILDITGKTIKIITTDLYKVNVANLPAGIYFIKVVTDGGTITKKFIKQ